MKRYVLLSISIIMFLLSVVGIYWYLAFGGIEKTANAYKVGVIDKIQVSGLDTFVTLENETQIKVKSKELVLVEISKEEEKKALEENENGFVPAYVYYLSTDKNMEFNTPFQYLAKFEQFDTYKDKVVYMSTKKDLDAFQKAVSGVPRYKSLQELVKAKNPELNVLEHKNTSEQEDLAVMKKIYSLSGSTYSDAIYYSPVIVLGIVLIFSFTYIGTMLFSKEEDAFDYEEEDEEEDILASDLAKKEPELLKPNEKKKGLKELTQSEIDKRKHAKLEKKEKEAEYSFISEIIKEDNKELSGNQAKPLPKRSKPSIRPKETPQNVPKVENDKIDIDAILDADNKELDSTNDELEIKHFKRRRKYD